MLKGYNNKLKAIVFFTITILIASLCVSYLNSSTKGNYSRKGYLDLSKWDFSKYGSVKLDGEWEFYWNKLISPSHFSSKSLKKSFKPDGFIKVPTEWHGTLGKLHLKRKGCATYRLRIKVKNYTGTLGIKTSSVRMSNRLFINGVLVGNSGEPSNSLSKKYVPANTPYEAFFTQRSGEIEIIMQVADFDYRAGGIVQSIFLGRQNDILAMSQRQDFLSILVSACLFITGLYYIFVFIDKRKDYSALYYSIYAISFCFIELFYYEKVMLKMFKMLENYYILILKFQNVLLNLTVIFACMFVREILNKSIPVIFNKIIIAILSIYSVFFLILPINVSGEIQNIDLTFGIFVYVFIVIFLIIGVLRGLYNDYEKRDSIILILAFVCVIIYFIDGTIYLNNISYNDNVGHIAMIIFVSVISMLLSSQYTRSYKTIQNMNMKLLEMDKLKDDFLANTSHELKTPLNGIINLTQAVLAKAKDNNQKEPKFSQEDLYNLDLVVYSGRRLSNLINDILDMSSLKHGQIELKKSYADIKSVASIVINVMESFANSKEIIFINLIPDNLPDVFADTERLRQIYYNLLGNAVKFTQKGKIEVGGKLSGDMLELYVEDTGCGIPNEKQIEIFEAFHQLKQDGGKISDGVGLGLSITKNLIELHGGKIRVYSEPGNGAKFIFTIPCAINNGKDKYLSDNIECPQVYTVPTEMYRTIVKSQDGSIVFGDKNKNKYKILIGEDDITNQSLMISIFNDEDYYIKILTDGDQVLKDITGYGKYDLIILDIMMPKMTGLDVLKRIRERFTNVDLPVLLLTAKSSQQDVKVGFDMGANDYVSKPFEIDELKARVSTLLKLRESISLLLNTELSFLQAQIKPHFLYNTITVISSLCIKDPKKARELLTDLSDYLRGSFNFENRDGLVFLSAELQTVSAYLAIEKARFKERLNVEYDIDKCEILIPILSVQPLVENAVRHGIMDKIDGGKIKISVKETKDMVLIIIEDDGLGMSSARISQIFESKNNKGVGVKNINKRLLSLYGKGLIIESNINEGTRITITIPKIQ